MIKDCVAAVAGERGQLWFGRVVNFDPDPNPQVLVQWFKSASKTKKGRFFFLDNFDSQTGRITKNSIICNGIHMRPERENPSLSAQPATWVWRLLVPQDIIKRTRDGEELIFYEVDPLDYSDMLLQLPMWKRKSFLWEMVQNHYVQVKTNKYISTIKKKLIIIFS